MTASLSKKAWRIASTAWEVLRQLAAEAARHAVIPVPLDSGIQGILSLHPFAVN
jgi:hypothetical protein